MESSACPIAAIILILFSAIEMTISTGVCPRSARFNPAFKKLTIESEAEDNRTESSPLVTAGNEIAVISPTSRQHDDHLDQRDAKLCRSSTYTAHHKRPATDSSSSRYPR